MTAFGVPDRARYRVRRRRRPHSRGRTRVRLVVAAAVSLIGHAALLVAIVLARAPPATPEPPVIQVTMVELPKPPPPAPAEIPVPGPPSAAAPPPKPTPVKVKDGSKRLKPLLAQVAPPTPQPAPVAWLSDSQLAGAGSADSGFGEGAGTGTGAGGASCDVARRLQQGLRADAQVQAALASGPHAGETSGRAVKVWDQDWIRSPTQEGEGLAVLREAIMMEILSFPEACRKQTMHGMVLISPHRAQGVRLAVGSGQWRWADLLTPSRGVPGHVAPR